jgi:hypothetical protein
MTRAQQILTMIAWAALVVAVIVILSPNGLLSGFVPASLALSAVSSLAAFGLSFKTRTGWLLALLPLLGVAGLLWWLWLIVTHLPIA